MLFSKWFNRSISAWTRATLLAVMLLGMLLTAAVQAETPDSTRTPSGTTWSQMTASAAWSERRGHTSVALPDGSIVLMGGYSSGGTRKNDVWRSTDGGTTWSEMTANAEWSPRDGHTSVILHDGSIVLMGGYDGSEEKNDIWRSTDGGENWELLTDSAPWGGRQYHTSVVLPNGHIVLMGGHYSNAFSEDIWRSTDGGKNWTFVAIHAILGRYYQTSVVLPDGSILLLGGADYKTRNDVVRSTDEGETWKPLTYSAGWSPRVFHTVVVLPDESIVLMGGNATTDMITPDLKNDVWRSTDGGANWTQLTASAEWSERHAHTSVVLPDGSIVLMGGTNNNDVWRSIILHSTFLPLVIR